MLQEATSKIEYIACDLSACQAAWILNLLQDLNIIKKFISF